MAMVVVTTNVVVMEIEGKDAIKVKIMLTEQASLHPLREEKPH